MPILKYIILFCAILFYQNTFSQNRFISEKENKELVKQAKKNSKRLIKEGWVSFTEESIEEQQYNILQLQTLQNDSIQYIIQTEEGIHPNRDIAYKQAEILTKSSITTLLESEAKNTTIIQNNDFNNNASLTSHSKLKYIKLSSIYKKNKDSFHVRITLAIKCIIKNIQ